MRVYGDKWQREASALARSFAPSVKACCECGNPVMDGYCCTACGSHDPSKGQAPFETLTRAQCKKLADERGD